MDNKSIILLSCIIITLILIAGFVIFFIKDDSEEEYQEPPRIIDDNVSPYLSQQLTVEILRIRNRGIIDKMLTFGRSWKNPLILKYRIKTCRYYI